MGSRPLRRDRRDTYGRATAYGVPVERIKPYPVITEPDHHDHYDQPDAAGWRTAHHADGPESACIDCTEPIPEEDTPLPLDGSSETR
ncbi:hypothetical protein SAMN05421872_102330 [Nocardioides lianchengensis]|uniref:Uncharacterized protein n=1 Tax=Nocardioides lianchengensis TaxID=1045774 RepID=A0A1G6LQS5_9ACTN|nr:hypothetical protein [Nocardioides lianchengensis]SDC45541.1 hypothetical protein SAMN05421872_102330 [Nocardioides lianchengensis]